MQRKKNQIKKNTQLHYTCFLLTVLFFSMFTGVYSVSFSDGPWILGDDYIYGFPFPYIWDNVVSSLERQIIISNMLLDFALYYVIIFLTSIALIKILSDKLKTLIPKSTRRVAFISLNLYVVLFFALQISLNDLNHYNWNYDYDRYGDEIKFEKIQIGPFFP